MAILAHGLGSSPDWWQPLESILRGLGIECVVPAMPSLEADGPDSWVKTVIGHITEQPTILVGHSLGAAVALMAAAASPVQGLIMCAMPPFLRGSPLPPTPPAALVLSTEARTRMIRFLRIASARASDGIENAVHFIGEADKYVSIRAAECWPIEIRLVPDATHDLTRSAHFSQMVADYITRSSFGARYVPKH